MIRNEATNRIRRYPLERKGKSTRPFRTFNTWNPDLVLLVGHFLFDGELSRGGCIYNNRSKALLERVEKIMRYLYDYEPKRWMNPSTGVYRISYFNVALVSYLKSKSERLLKEIPVLSLSCKRALLQSFFDDEGCVDFRPATNHRKVRGYQKDVSILKLVQSLLKDFGIPARLVPPNEVTVQSKEDLLRFEQKINFSHGIYINGNRANSRWKKNIEKRQLLRMAIESFKT